MDNREKMPCFDPREVMFLTNQWDAIKNVVPLSDEDDADDFEKVDTHTQTWNYIKRELRKHWGCINVDNIFRISLEQVNILYLLATISPNSIRSNRKMSSGYYYNMCIN